MDREWFVIELIVGNRITGVEWRWLCVEHRKNLSIRLQWSASLVQGNADDIFDGNARFLYEGKRKRINKFVWIIYCLDALLRFKFFSSQQTGFQVDNVKVTRSRVQQRASLFRHNPNCLPFLDFSFSQMSNPLL